MHCTMRNVLFGTLHLRDHAERDRLFLQMFLYARERHPNVNFVRPRGEGGGTDQPHDESTWFLRTRAASGDQLFSSKPCPEKNNTYTAKNHLIQDSYESNLVSFPSHYPAFRPKAPCSCLYNPCTLIATDARRMWERHHERTSFSARDRNPCDDRRTLQCAVDGLVGAGDTLRVVTRCLHQSKCWLLDFLGSTTGIRAVRIRTGGMELALGCFYSPPTSGKDENPEGGEC